MKLKGRSGSTAHHDPERPFRYSEAWEGVFKPSLDRVLPLSQAAEAHRLNATNQVTGNIVLLPWPNSTFGV